MLNLISVLLLWPTPAPAHTAAASTDAICESHLTATDWRRKALTEMNTAELSASLSSRMDTITIETRAYTYPNQLGEVEQLRQRAEAAAAKLRATGLPLLNAEPDQAALLELLVISPDIQSLLRDRLAKESGGEAHPVRLGYKLGDIIENIFSIKSAVRRLGTRGYGYQIAFAQAWVEAARGNRPHEDDLIAEYVGREIRNMKTELAGAEPRVGVIRDRAIELSTQSFVTANDRAELENLKDLKIRPPKGSAIPGAQTLAALNQALTGTGMAIFGYGPDASAQIERLRTEGVTEDFFNNWWWRASTINNFSDITGRTSMSLAARLHNATYGRNWRRTIHWPVATNSGTARDVDLAQVRVAVNEAPNGMPISMEMLVRDVKGDWQPLFFEREGSRWVYRSHIKGVPLVKACAECHSAQSRGLWSRLWRPGKLRLTPAPSILKTTNDYLRVGYKDSDLIQRMLNFR